MTNSQFFSVEIVIYMLSYGMGVGIVPWLLIGELCPMEVQFFIPFG